jgi:hypothetical protein
VRFHDPEADRTRAALADRIDAELAAANRVRRDREHLYDLLGDLSADCRGDQQLVEAIGYIRHVLYQRQLERIPR